MEAGKEGGKEGRRPMDGNNESEAVGDKELKAWKKAGTDADWEYRDQTWMWRAGHS